MVVYGSLVTSSMPRQSTVQETKQEPGDRAQAPADSGHNLESQALQAKILKKLDAFCLDVEVAATPGFTILFGPSGAGKTTLLDCIAGLLTPDTGRISVGAFGELLTGLALADVVERINRHFGVHRPTTMHIEEFPADIPLATDASPKTGDRVDL